MTVLVTAAEMRAIETDAVEHGQTWEGLMDQAGEAVARLAIQRLGPESKHRVLVLVGPGNNGGDALVVARHLAEHGWEVRCLTWSREMQPTDRLLVPLRGLGIIPQLLSPDAWQTQIDTALDWCTSVVDGVFGTGLKRDITSPLADIIKRVAASGKTVGAIDIPSGVDSDTGQVRGVALAACYTVATGLLKYGHALQPGKRLSGNIYIGDIKVSQATSQATAKGTLLTDADIKKMLPERPEDANKGTFGKAMIVAGSVNYIGAAALATEGAMRSGAGVVTLACAGDLLPILAVKLTECTFLPLSSDLGAIAERATEKLHTSLKGYSALLVGCGIGREKETADFVRSLLAKQDVAVHSAARPIGFARVVDNKPKEDEHTTLPPLVLDGDALNILSEWSSWSDHVPHNSVLTPHPGEMARLTGKTVDEVQADRVGIATEHAAKWKQVVVLKGASTLIAEPGGKVYVSPFSNPALSTAGTGDVLAGTIAGLLAQGLEPVQAACVGVYLHGKAGELLREQFGEAGGLSGDLARLMPLAQKALREGGNG
jgi:ADP-dependent NAD(P)H-hydrate dehydratase / NAD(P)H-hydrate epimerase